MPWGTLDTALVAGKPFREFTMLLLSRRTVVGGSVLAAAGAALRDGSAAAETVPLAIQGYDPVAYFTAGKATHGSPEFEYEWDEHRYRFVSAENRELFKADPVHYAPQFGNYCAMALAKGEIVVANPENWLITDGKLYIFGKPAPAGPIQFRQNLSANVAKANQNRAILPEN